jgi:hypothetical protein
VRYPAALPTLALAAGIAAGVFLPAVRIPPALFLCALILDWLIAAFAALRERRRLFLFQILSGFALSGVVLGHQASGAALRMPLGQWFDFKSSADLRCPASCWGIRQAAPRS